jgi:hypothetical protein
MSVANETNNNNIIDDKDNVDYLLSYLPSSQLSSSSSSSSSSLRITNFKIIFIYGETKKVVEILNNYIPNYLRNYLNRLIMFVGNNPLDYNENYLQRYPNFHISLEINNNNNILIISHLEKKIKDIIIEKHYKPYTRFLENLVSIKSKEMVEIKEQNQLWKGIAENPNISEEFIRNHLNKINIYNGFKESFKNRNLSENFFKDNFQTLVENNLLEELGKYIIYNGNLYLQIINSTSFDTLSFIKGLMHNKTVPHDVKKNLAKKVIWKDRMYYMFVRDLPETEYREIIGTQPDVISKVKWNELCKKTYLSEQFYLDFIESILRYPSSDANNGPLQLLCKNLSLSEYFFRNLVEFYPEKFTIFEWQELCRNSNISIFFYRDHIQQIIESSTLNILLVNPIIGEETVENLLNLYPNAFGKGEWIFLLLGCNVSENFINKHMKTINKFKLSNIIPGNKYLPIDYIKQLIKKDELIDNSIFHNSNLPENFLEDYINNNTLIDNSPFIQLFHNKHYYDHHWIIKELTRKSVTNKYQKEVTSKTITNNSNIISDLSNIIADY